LEKLVKEGWLERAGQ